MNTAERILLHEARTAAEMLRDAFVKQSQMIADTVGKKAMMAPIVLPWETK